MRVLSHRSSTELTEKIAHANLGGTEKRRILFGRSDTSTQSLPKRYLRDSVSPWFASALFSAPSARLRLPPADEANNLDFIPFADRRLIVLVSLDHRHVVLDGDDAGVDVELGEQRADRDGAGDLERLAIQSYGQTRILP